MNLLMSLRKIDVSQICKFLLSQTSFISVFSLKRKSEYQKTINTAFPNNSLFTSIFAD